jgi:hypothetical protein
MNLDTTKKSNKLAWPGRKAARRRVLIIALVLFPCTWIVNAFLIGSWNLLGDRNAESYRHLREAGTIFVGTVCMVFLATLLPSMQRFVKWISSWRVIRRGLIVLAWMVTIIALFYGEEDWRGRHAWNKYSDALTAKGEVLDLKAFIPKPVPDAENFAATPEIQSWFIRYTNGGAGTYSNMWATDNFGSAGGMVSGDVSKLPPRLTDLVAWKMAFAAVQAGTEKPAQDFKSGNAAPEARAEAARAVLEALKPLEPRLEELRAASSRPGVHYPVIYDLENPWGILLPHISNIKGVCLRLDLRACAELAAGQSDRALDDVKLMLRMGDSLEHEPFLISYLYRLATFQIAAHTIWEGLAEHRWSDAQLKELLGLLQKYDFIADLKPPLDEERASGILTADLLAAGKFSLNELTTDTNPTRGSAANAFGKIMPHGWFEMEKLNYCRLFNLQLEGDFDVSAKRVFPEKITSNMKALDQAFAGRNPFTTIFTRHQLLAAVMVPALGNVHRLGAMAQVAAEEAMLACALERYRLAHSQFPDKLDALTLDFISGLPHDVITGNSYKYQRTADSFLLYSVGWNETDDGGKVVMKGSSLDPTEGDWVWQYPAK